jgi:predicted lipid-binding transport protein (Tim44 family)
VLNFIRFLVSAFFRVETRTPAYFQNELMPDTASLGPDITPQPMWQKAHQQIEALQKIDPEFNEVAFLDYAAKSYLQALSAEGAMDPTIARDVISPAYATRLAGRIDDWKNEGFRRVISGQKLDGTTLFKVSLDGVSESLVVRMAGAGVRYTLDTASGVAAEGSVKNVTFSEFATFVRPTGTVTPKTAQLGGPTHCPSCGAPAPMMATKCEFCNTPLTPAGAPWLLDHVSQSAYT